MSKSLPEPTVYDPLFLQAPRPHPTPRFQRKQYAPIDIVLTEKKGFGLRAAANLSRFVVFVWPTMILAFLCGFFSSLRRDTFIYEYVGDVLSSPSMKKRMREYGKEGIEHFYFMMLQKDEVRLSSMRFMMGAKLVWSPRVVYRRHQEGRNRAIREPQLQPQLLRRKMDHWGSSANGNLFQEGRTEGRGAHFQLQCRSIRVGAVFSVLDLG